MISSIFACTFREAVISVLTERAPLRRSLNRADAVGVCERECVRVRACECVRVRVCESACVCE